MAVSGAALITEPMSWTPRSLSIALALAAALAGSVSAEGDRRTEIVPQILHSAEITFIAVSPDGRQLVTASSDSTLKLWSAASGQLVRTFRDHSAEVLSVAFSADGRRILSGSFDHTVKLWDAATGKVVRTFKKRTDEPFDLVRSVQFSSDGKQVFSGIGDAPTLWDASTGKLLRSLKHSELVASAALSRDGRYVLAGYFDGTVKIWEAKNGRDLQTFDGQAGPPYAVAFSPDGRQVAAGIDHLVKVWDVESGQLVRSLQHRGMVADLAFSSDGQLLLAAAPGELKLWNAKTGSLVRSARGPFDGSSCAFSPDGARVFAGGNRKISVWDLATGRLQSVTSEGAGAITTVSFLPGDRQAMAGGDDRTIRFWDLANGQLVRMLPAESRVLTLVPSANGKQVLAGSETSLKLLDTGSGEVVRTFSQDGIFAGLKDRFDTWRGVVAKPRGFAATALSADGRLALSSRIDLDAPVELWDVASGKPLQTVAWHRRSRVNAMAFSPDGQRAVTNDSSGAMKLWDTATGALLHELKRPHQISKSVVYSSDGRRIFVGAGVGFEVWDAASGKILQQLTVPEDQNIEAVRPDGKRVVAGRWEQDRYQLSLWDVATKRPVRTLPGYFNNTFGGSQKLAYSSDGKRILWGDEDSTMRLLNDETGELVATFISSPEGEWLALTPEGFFNASSPAAGKLLAVVQGLEPYRVDQMWQSLYAPDLVREKLAGDPDGEVARAAAVTSLDKVLASGQAPRIAITSPAPAAKSADEIIKAEATLSAEEGGGIGRVEWRVNGITVGVSTPASNSGPTLTVSQTLALDPGENTIEAVAYNRRNLLASVPAQTTVTWTGTATTAPKLHVLAIGINKYVDKGAPAPGETEAKRFPPLGLAVPDAKALADELKKAGHGLYGDVRVRTVLDEEATSAKLDAIVTEVAAEIAPRDTFVLYAATHGYSHQGRFYLIPQDFQGGPDPQALATRAIDQLKLQDWIANRIRAKKALILLDSCESGALTSGYSRSRFDGPESDAAIGRLHEAIGRPVLTAAGLGQSALELSELGHGVFTSALIDSFYRGDANSDDVVSVSELVSHVQNLVPKLIKDPNARAEVIRRGAIGGVQSARFGGRGEDFALVHRLQ